MAIDSRLLDSLDAPSIDENFNRTLGIAEDAAGSVLPAAPEDDGAYVLTCTVAGGKATLSWESAGE